MKKYEKYVYLVLGLIFVSFLSSGITYFIMKDNEKRQEPIVEEKNPVQEEKIEDNVSLIKTTQEENRVVQEYEITMNNKKKKMNVYFERKDKYEYTATSDQNVTVYTEMTLGENSKIYTVDEVNQFFNTSNFKFIKGTDEKTYLIIASYYKYPAGGPSSYINILDDELNLLAEDGEIVYMHQNTTFELEENVWYKDDLNLCNKNHNCQVRIKIEQDKITNLYYLNDDRLFEERVYTIFNGKLEYTTVNKYKVLKEVGAGQ